MDVDAIPALDLHKIVDLVAAVDDHAKSTHGVDAGQHVLSIDVGDPEVLYVVSFECRCAAPDEIAPLVVYVRPDPRSIVILGLLDILVSRHQPVPRRQRLLVVDLIEYMSETRLFSHYFSK